MQVVNAAPSRLHWRLPPDSVELKAKLALALLVSPFGPLVMIVSGAMVSTVKPRVAGVGSMLPAGSTARTESVYTPSASV